jgi:peptidoglycan/xylan/chitin deacetylase (PgdA/CDA1 family)
MGRARRELLAWSFKRPAALKAGAPLLTFTFDDFPKSARTAGAPIVESFGGRATYYTAMGLCGKETTLGRQFDADDLRLLVEHGHEIGNHTFSHRSARRCSSFQFLGDVRRCEVAFRTEDVPNWTRHFAYPYGEATFRIKGRLGATMSSCRGTQPGWNGPVVDLNLLRANPLYGGIEQGQAALDLIRENAERAGWIIFYTHDVSDSPSRYGCTPALLEYVARCAAEHAHHSMSVGQVVETRLV